MNIILSQYHKAVTLLLPLLVIGGTCFGAETTSNPIITAKIKCLSMGGNISDIDILVAPDKRLPISAPSTYISKAYAYTGPSTITLVRSKKKPAPGATESASNAKYPAAAEPEILASVTIPPPGGDFLLLFAGSVETKLNLLAIPFSATDVPVGSCLVWNITPRPLGVVVGTERALLAPERRQVFKPVTVTKNYFDLRVFDEFEGKTRPLVGGPNFMPDESRQLIFIAERIPGHAAIQVKVVEEIPELKPQLNLQPQTSTARNR